MNGINEDAAMHTATSGSPAIGADGIFDSQILNMEILTNSHLRCR